MIARERRSLYQNMAENKIIVTPHDDKTINVSMELGLPSIKIIEQPIHYSELKGGKNEGKAIKRSLNKNIGGTIELFTSMNKESIIALKKTRIIEESKSLEVAKLRIAKGQDVEQ